VDDLRPLAARWALPAVWASLPFTVGPALASALDPRSRPVQVVASVGAWLVWAAALGAALVPRTTSLTAVRIVAPAALVLAGWAALEVGEVGAEVVVALAASAVAAALALAPGTAERHVDGSSYGEERRFPLRPPGALLLGPLPLTWAVAVAGVVSGPLLLAARAWVAGAVALAVGLPAAAVAVRALHALSRRWLVLVPAGLVVHDRMAVQEPVLVLRRQVRSLGPAPADTTALDLTVGALGLALELDLHEPVSLVPAGRRGTPVELQEVTSLLVSPTRPGAVLAAASQRRLPVRRGTGAAIPGPPAS
jgi:hypothetical protein